MQSGLLVFTDALGIVAFALAGILAAQDKDVDPVGVFVVAFVTAFGGGIVRDMIIDNRPMYWTSHQEYIWITLALAALAPSIIRRFQNRHLHTLFVWSDAVGLGFFAAGGTSLSISAGLPALPAVLMGVCTGVFGGLLRDVFLTRLPLVMSDRVPYASVAFAGSWLYVGLHEANVDENTALIISSLAIIAVRMVSWYKDWAFISYTSSFGTKPDDRDPEAKP